MIGMKKMLKNMTLASFVVIALLLPIFSRAASLPTSRPFGGKILSIIPPNPLAGCFFPLIVVGPPSPGIFAITPIIRPYREFQFYRPGAWVLGTSPTLSRVCGVPPATGISIIGTSF